MVWLWAQAAVAVREAELSAVFLSYDEVSRTIPLPAGVWVAFSPKSAKQRSCGQDHDGGLGLPEFSKIVSDVDTCRAPQLATLFVAEQPR